MSIALSDFGIVYMPIPKAACTSIKVALSQIDPNSPISSQDLGHDPTLVHKHYRTRRFRPHRWEPFCDGNWWRFAVVRDPLKRIISLYNNRVVGLGELRHSPRLRAQSRLPLDPDPNFFFQHLKDYADLSSVVKHHALSVRLFLGPKPFRFDRIYRTDEIGELEAELTARTNQPVKVSRFNESTNNLDLSDLTDKTITSLHDLLRTEYDLLSEYFVNPFEQDAQSVRRMTAGRR